MPSQAMACGSVTTGVRRAYSAEFATRITWPASAMSRWISCASSVALASAASSAGSFAAREAHDLGRHLRRRRQLQRFVGHGRSEECDRVVGAVAARSVHGLMFGGDPFR